MDDIIKAEITPEKLSPNADVYEFKEPEPFEFESRKPSSEEKKKRGVIRWTTSNIWLFLYFVGSIFFKKKSLDRYIHC